MRCVTNGAVSQRSLERAESGFKLRNRKKRPVKNHTDNLASPAEHKAPVRIALTCAALLLAMVTSLVGAQESRAAAFNYSTGGQLQTINVGFLDLDSDTQTGSSGIDHPGWYSFYILNERPDIKPAGWTLANPSAPKVVTADIQGRYSYKDSGGVLHAYTIGQPITSNMAPYWEVDITKATAGTLSQYNLLAIHANHLIDLNRQERLLLRQFMDEGGTLWVDDCGTAATGYGFLFDAQFGSGAGAGTAVVPNPASRSPIITTPFFLSQDELNGLGDKKVGGYYLSAGRGTAASTGNGAPDPGLLTTVLANSGANGLPYMSAGDYGSGHIVISAGDIFDDISTPVDPDTTNTNSDHQPLLYSNTDFTAAASQDLELLVNVISWGTDTSATDGVQDRHTGAQSSDVNGAMAKEWLYPNSSISNYSYSGGNTTAAIYGNIAYVTDTSGYLHAFDIDPPESLVGLLNPDDGAAGNDPNTNVPYLDDYDQGATYDELWMAQPGDQPLSAPTVALAQLNSTGPAQPYVFVEGDDGTVFAYAASTSPTMSGNLASPVATLKPTSTTTFSSTGELPPAPTVYNNRLIAGQADGTVQITELSNPANTFAVASAPPGSATGDDKTPAIASPTIASIPSNDGLYGGDDVVAYVTTKEFVEALLLGSRDESIQPANGTTDYQVKPGLASSQISQSQAEFALIGPPEDPATYGAEPGVYHNSPSYPEPVFDNPGYALPGFNVAPTDTAGDNYAPPYYADYDISTAGTGTGGTPPSLTRSQIYEAIANEQSTVGSNSNPTAIAAGAPAVGPDNTLYLAVNEPTLSSAYIEAIAEQNPNLTGGPREVIKWRFALVSGVTDASNISYNFSGYQFVGSPVVDGTTVYALAQPNLANGVGGQPIVLAFYTGAVCGVHATSGGTGATATGSDESGGTDSLGSSQMYYNPNTGILTVTNFDANPPSDFEVVPNIAAPYPLTVTVAVTGTTDQTASPNGSALPLDTSLGGSTLLQWWTAPLSTASAASNIQVGPLRKIGNYVYFPASFVNNTTSGQMTNEMVAVDTALGVGPNDTGATDQQIVIGNLSAAQQQAFVQTFPLAVGSATQPTSTPAPLPALASSGDFAVIQGPTGIEGFGYHPTLIADNNRLIELAPGGNAIWAVDSTNQQQIQGGNLTDEDVTPGQDDTGQVVTSKVSLSHPASISQVGQDDYLVADSGNNRVVRLDNAGDVTWELTSFTDPQGLLAAASTTPANTFAPNSNPLLSLNDPTYAAMWQTQDTASGTVTFHYLIADSGNYRIVEVDDTYTANGAIAQVGPNNVPLYHYLAWVSHTFDQANRQYRYISAQLVTGPQTNGTPGYFVLAGVSNKQVAPLALVNGAVQLAPANQDGPGSSIVLLSYQPQTQSPYLATGGLPDGVIGELANDDNTTTGYAFTPIRGLRSVQAQTLPNAGNGTSLWQITIADDDGVFSGPVEEVPAPVTTPLPPLTALPEPGPTMYPLAIDYTYNSSSTVTGFSLTTSTTNGVANGSGNTAVGYTGIVWQYDNNVLGNNAVVYQNTPFKPASAVRLASGNYLIVNGSVAGNPQNLGTDTGTGTDFGGDVFEVAPDGVLQGSILGRPGNSSSLSGPSYAIRPL